VRKLGPTTPAEEGNWIGFDPGQRKLFQNKGIKIVKIIYRCDFSHFT
jgi:hypothetical protein